MMCDLKELLSTWKMENILAHLIDEEIDIQTLKIIKPLHVKTLLVDFPLGRQIRFEHKLEQWRYRIGKPLRNEFVLEETTNQHHIESPSQNCSKNAVQHQSYCISSVELKEILMVNQPEGPELLDIYNKNQIFSSPERSLLIDLIVNHQLRQSLPFDLYESYEFENAILSLFPNEKLDYYRDKREGKIYMKYLKAKAVYSNTNEDLQLSDSLTSQEHKLSKKARHKSRAERVLNADEELSKNSLKDSHIGNKEKMEKSSTSSQVPTDIFLKTVYNNSQKFVKIAEPFLLKDFFLSACSIFNIRAKNNIFVTVNDCEISAEEFKNVILQYYRLPTFNVELKEKENKIEQMENTVSQAEFYKRINSFLPAKTFNLNERNNASIQIIVNHLPDANDIRNIPSLLPIVKMSDDGRPLENKHRTAIAKAIIDECLNSQPERGLKRQDFFTLTDSLIQAFPKEIASAYFIPSQPNQPARGKLWNAYNNKRSFLGNSGIVQRRHHSNAKRKFNSDEDEYCEKTNDKIYVTENLIESEEFSINSSLDWEIVQKKWSACHQERRRELLKDKMPPEFYLQKYSILKTNRGIDLMEIDVNILHPTVVNVNNWLSLYEKVLEMARKMQKQEQVSHLLEIIDSSNNEKFRASLTLLIIPYIFPYNGRRNEFNEKASKYDIQKRFITEFASLDDLQADIECCELQIRFVHQSGQIIYAEFKIAGQIFKSLDLLAALSSVFHYTVAMNMDYPKMLTHIWQFIQLAIFQIEIQGYKQPNVESTINDLYMI